MGNITSIATGPQQVVRVVRQDGKVLEFGNDMQAAELLVVYPKFNVFQDQVQANGQVRRISLAPDDFLRCGQIYLLLHQSSHQHHQKVHGSGSKGLKIHHVVGTSSSLGGAPSPQQHQHQQQARIGATIKPVISTQQIAKLLEKGSVQITTKNGMTARLNGPQLTRLLSEASGRQQQHHQQLTKRKLRGLESIPEEPVKAVM